MSKDSANLLKILGIAILIVIISGLFMRTGSIDMHIHDTYFVMNSITQMILLALSTFFIIGLFGAVLTKFRRKLYVKVLLFSVFLLISFGIYIFSLLATVK